MEALHAKPLLLDALAEQRAESLEAWSRFPTATFFAPIGEAWSPAENVRHLVKSMRPVVKALRMHPIVLRMMFGKSDHGSVSYDGLVARYRQALSEGGTAGRFAPSSRIATDLGVWRAQILSEFESVHHQLCSAIERWTEPKLDRLRLPHPLLGKLTVREMLYFTLYHERHHLAGVQRRFRTED
jgi:hypothetical protein